MPTTSLASSRLWDIDLAASGFSMRFGVGSAEILVNCIIDAFEDLHATPRLY